MRPAFDRLLSRRGILVEGPRFDFFHPLGHPVMLLPVWVAELARRRGRTLGPEVVSNLAVASQAGYLHVRVHDDYFDHHREEATGSMLLASALLVHHQALLARYLPASHEFWQLFEQRWLDYGQALHLESRLVLPESEYTWADYEAVLRQAQPLVLGGAAVLALTGLWEELLDPLERFVSYITLSAQLFNDVSGADEDWRDGRFTWVVRSLGGLQGQVTLRRRLLFEGGLDTFVAKATDAAESAATVARELGLHEALNFLEQRKRAMTERVEQVYRSLFQGFLAKPPATPES